jgi:hypothetical protein
MISRDFDFEFGQWTVHHRRLKERLTGCTEWEEFSGTTDARPVLNGNGNVEDNVLHFPAGTYRAIAIRSFDPSAGTWAIWWLSALNPHQMDVPVIGRFDGPIGTFTARDTLRGQPVDLRFRWDKTDPERPIWDQALSEDGGDSWEVNWVMAFRRA